MIRFSLIPEVRFVTDQLSHCTALDANFWAWTNPKTLHYLNSNLILEVFSQSVRKGSCRAHLFLYTMSLVIIASVLPVIDFCTD